MWHSGEVVISTDMSQLSLGGGRYATLMVQCDFVNGYSGHLCSNLVA